MRPISEPVSLRRDVHRYWIPLALIILTPIVVRLAIHLWPGFVADAVIEYISLLGA